MKKTIVSVLLALAVQLPVSPSAVFTAPFFYVEKNTVDAPDLWKKDMLDRVNLLRSKGCHCGRKYMPPAPPLRWNDRLEKAAARHANDMKRHDFFSHKGSNGSGIGDRAERAGYRWQSVAENIAWNYDTVADAVLGWKDSPGHCRSMMSKAYREMGAAQVDAYWVQLFGSPMP